MTPTSGARRRSPVLALLLALALGIAMLTSLTPPAIANSEGQRGTTLGSASYPAPSGAIYASPQGSDSGAGTLTSPVRTLERALALAPAGGTVVLRAGTYHESVILKKKVTIQNYPREVVWLDGSAVVSNWTLAGTVWTAPWTTFFGTQNYHGGVRADRPFANRTDQVFVDGKALMEVGSQADVRPGTFFPDAKNKRLVIGTNPSGKTVTASKLDVAIEASANDITLRGFGVRRYASSTPNRDVRGAIIVATKGGVFENLVISDNAALGMGLTGDGKAVNRVVVERNGMVGLGIHRSNNSSITNSVFDDNNSEVFPREPSASAVKITKSDNMVVENNTFSNTTLAAGLWFDMFNRNATVINNTFADNGAMGLNVEAVLGGIVANNVFTGGVQSIVNRDSESISIINNSFRNYTVMAVNLAQDNRWTAKPSDTPSDFSLRIRNVLIANNVFACGTRFQIFANDESGSFDASKFGLTITGNVFSAQQKSPELNLAYWGATKSGTASFIQKVSDLDAKGSSWKNLQATSCTGAPQDTKSPAELASVLHPMPSAVARVLGVETGLKAIGPIASSTPPATDNPAPAPSVNDFVDTFSKSASGSWPASDSGTGWSVSGGSAAFATSNGVGTIQLSPRDNREAYPKVDASATNSSTVSIGMNALPVGGNASMTVIGRRIGSDHYAGRLLISPNGNVRLYALRNETPLGDSVLVGTFKAGTSYQVKTEVTGTSPTTIRVKAWTGAEPSAWTISVTDSAGVLQGPGTAGLKAYLGSAASGAVTYLVDNYRLRTN